MSMPIVWTCTLLMEFIIPLVMGAPKLGHVLFDPLTYEAEKFEQLKTLLLSTNIISTTQEETTITPATETITTAPTEEMTPEIPDSTDITNANMEDFPNNLSYNYFKLIENALDILKKLPKPSRSLRTGDSLGPETKDPCVEYEYNGKICKFINGRLLCGYDKNKGELKNDQFVDIGKGCRIHHDRIECGYVTGPFNNPRRPPAREKHINENETINSVKNTPRLRSGQKTTSERTPNTKFTSELVSMLKIETTRLTPKPVKTIQVMTDSKRVTSTTQVTVIPIHKLMTTTTQTKIRKKTTKRPELVMTPKLTEISLEYATNLVKPQSQVTSNVVVPMIPIVENSSPSAKVARSILRSIAETPTDKPVMGDITPGAVVLKQPRKWCVEKGHRIVCYYSKNI